MGVSPDPIRRLRQHNGEIKGGAKYTTSKGCGWKHICLISGFEDKIQAMRLISGETCASNLGVRESYE